MEEYYIISCKKEKDTLQRKVEPKYLMINLVLLKKQNYEFIEVVDNYGKKQDIKEMIQIYKDSIDIEYIDVKSKLEAFRMASLHFKELYENKQIDGEIYGEYFIRIKRGKRYIKEKEEYINMIKNLYIDKLVCL